jgi:hypothetical protein
MNVTTFPCRAATFLHTYLYIITLSAIVSRSWYRMSISHCPPVATSWWCASTGMPSSTSVETISLRMFCIVSIGGVGK